MENVYYSLKDFELSLKKNAIERADDLSLIHILPYSMQILLLRVLQEKEFNPVGSDKVKRTNVRIISARCV